MSVYRCWRWLQNLFRWCGSGDSWWGWSEPEKFSHIWDTHMGVGDVQVRCYARFRTYFYVLSPFALSLFPSLSTYHLQGRGWDLRCLRQLRPLPRPDLQLRRLKAAERYMFHCLMHTAVFGLAYTDKCPLPTTFFFKFMFNSFFEWASVDPCWQNNHNYFHNNRIRLFM